MRSRFVALVLTLCLFVAFFGCSKKPEQTGDTSAAPNAVPFEKKPSVQTVTIPAGTALTVRLGQSVSVSRC